MRQSQRAVFTFAVTIVVLFCAVAMAPLPAAGQSTKKVFPPLLVAKLRSAKTVSIGYVKSLDREDAEFFGRQTFATVEMWRLYQVVPTSAGADLVFEPSVEAGA